MLFAVVVCYWPTAMGFVGAFLLYAFIFGAAWPLLYAVSPTTFPTVVRTTGVSFASACAKLGSVVQPQISGHLLEHHMFAVGLINAGAWLLTLGAVGVLMSN